MKKDFSDCDAIKVNGLRPYRSNTFILLHPISHSLDEVLNIWLELYMLSTEGFTFPGSFLASPYLAYSYFGVRGRHS
jgi:hypothetical protein